MTKSCRTLQAGNVKSPSEMSTEALKVEIELAVRCYEDAWQRLLTVQLSGKETIRQINAWRTRYSALAAELERRDSGQS